MATIEGGPGTNVSAPTIRFTNQGLTYQTLQGDHYQKIRQVMTTRFEAAEQHARARYERFYRFEKLIHMVSKKKLYDWKANAFLPYAFSVAEQSAAMKFLALFQTRPYVTVQARRAGLDQAAMRRQSLIDWHLTSDIDMTVFGGDMLRIAERYGKAVGVVTPKWEHNVRKFRSRDELPTALGPVARMSWKMSDRRDYKIEAFALDNTDFVPEPGKRRINGPQGMRWCFRKYALGLEELLSLEQDQMIGPSVGGQSVLEISNTQDQEMNEYKLRRMFLDRSDDVDRYHDQFDRTVELVETQMIVPRELLDSERAQQEEAAGRDPTHRMMILANRQAVIQDIALPWDHGLKSFVEVDCVPDPYDFWGKGKIEPIEHLIYVGNEITNMRIDNVKMAINGLIGVDSTKMPPGWKRRLVSQPWGVMECLTTPSLAMERLQLGDVTASSYTEQQQLWTLIQEAAAVNETLMGAPGPARTLGEHQLKAETASKRLQFELIGSAQQLLGWPYGLARFIIGLDRQYLPLPTYIEMMDPDSPDEFTEISIGPETLSDEDEKFSYMPTGSTEGLNIQAKRADLAAMIQALSPLGPILPMLQFNFAEFVRTIMKTFGHDPARFFPKTQGVMEPGQGVGLGEGPGPGQIAQPGGAPRGQNPVMAALGGMGGFGGRG